MFLKSSGVPGVFGQSGSMAFHGMAFHMDGGMTECAAVAIGADSRQQTADGRQRVADDGQQKGE